MKKEFLHAPCIGWLKKRWLFSQTNDMQKHISANSGDRFFFHHFFIFIIRLALRQQFPHSLSAINCVLLILEFVELENVQLFAVIVVLLHRHLPCFNFEDFIFVLARNEHYYGMGRYGFPALVFFFGWATLSVCLSKTVLCSETCWLILSRHLGSSQLT